MIRLSSFTVIVASLVLIFTHFDAFGQSTDRIQWISFQKLDSVFDERPKKVFIDFQTDWCGYCKRMDKYAFNDPEVIHLLNDEYYAIKMDAESPDSIYFAGRMFYNKKALAGKQGFHELALFLGKPKSGIFSVPTMVIFDEEFRVKEKYHQYLHAKKLLKILQ